MKKVYPLFLGDVNLNGQFLADNKEKLKKYMLGLGGKRAQLLIKPWRRIRSLNQNRYYWVW